MARYRYVVKDSKGASITNEVEEFSKEALIEKLQKQGYFILKIEAAGSSAAPTQKTAAPPANKKQFTHKKIKLADIIGFARQLVTMLEAGVTLMRSLQVITGQTDSQRLYEVLRQVTHDVERGQSLSEALGNHPRVFNQFWVSLVEVGEASGTLPRVLNKLAFYLEQQERFRSTIISAIMYPAILFVICCGAISFFALFVGPRFEEVFKSMGVKLPFITVFLLETFRFIKQKFLLMVGALVVFFFGMRAYGKTRPGKYQLERFLFSLPTVGNIFRLIIVERFTSQMAILVESGVPIMQALDIAQRLVDNSICADVIGKIKESVRSGELLATPMQASGFFPGMAIQMITVGEETGELSKMLKHVADFYQETVETFMKRLGTVIEPFMLVFMGSVIGIIVVAMFMPMFNMAQLGGASGG